MDNSCDHIRKEAMVQYGFGPDVMKRVKVCGMCGTGADAGQIFCMECGDRLPDATLFDLYKQNHVCCPACGTVLPDLAQFCSCCGVKLSSR